MPRFVVLEHDHPYLHWDLMLEAGDTLRTWRLEKPPLPGVDTRAEPLGRHRRAYLDYEGPLSGNRGSVQRWDAGEFTWVQDTANRLLLSLHGYRCRGGADLFLTPTGDWILRLSPVSV